MSDSTQTARRDPPTRATRLRETLTFLVLAFGIWPIISIAVVGGFGFVIWMFQIIAGPPGPPGG